MLVEKASALREAQVNKHNAITVMLLSSSSAYLRFCEAQRSGHLKTLGSRQVLVEFELTLKFQQLLTGEGCARTAGFT
jgi:hypothetical protein